MKIRKTGSGFICFRKGASELFCISKLMPDSCLCCKNVALLMLLMVASTAAAECYFPPLHLYTARLAIDQKTGRSKSRNMYRKNIIVVKAIFGRQTTKLVNTGKVLTQMK